MIMNKSIYLFLVINICNLSTISSYEIPNPNLQLLKPSGIRISIPDEHGVEFFAFHGNINHPIGVNENGQISGETSRSRGKNWSFEDKNIAFQDQDVLHYWIYVQANGRPYSKTGRVQSEKIDSRLRKRGSSNCVESISIKRSTKVECRDELIFEETFDEDQNQETGARNSSWAREIILPLDPDYEFCVYRELPNSVEFENGIMSIGPLILDDVYGENATLFGRLDLRETCTGSMSLECNRRAVGSSILPPVISARLTTKNSFHFRYGKIEIRAKFPKGDWLYPELWLEPKQRTYGFGYSSGRVILGMTRGNEHLTNISNSIDPQYGSTILEFGVRTGATGAVREDKITKKRDFSSWNDDFHVYTTIWDESGFEFHVDGQKIGKISPGAWLESDQSNIANMAPYDREFYMTIGLGVGGIRVFPDGTVSGRFAKPWRNVEAKAMLNFWLSRDQWLPSWRYENGEKDSHLQIDYVKVWSV